MCINWLKSKLCDGYISPPKHLEDLSGTEALSILQAEFPNAAIYVSDLDYKTTTVDELRRFLREDLTDKDRYVKELYDCDDFSFKLMGQLSTPEWGSLAFGILWVEKPNDNYHAINVFIDNERDVYYVEPQDDNVASIPESWKGMLIIL